MTLGVRDEVLTCAAIISLLMAIVGNRPERRPGNLAPIQLISAMGAWALVLANASAIAIAIHDGSVILLCTVAATLTIALTSFIRDHATNISSRETPAAVKLVVDDLKQLLGGAPRLGMDSLDAVVVAGRCPGIGVTVVQQGGVVVRIRQDVVRWLEGHQQAGGAGAAVVESFVRFTVLHELGHVLNGDHLTFRFVRSVLIAHLVWIAGALAAAASLVVSREASATPLFVGASIVLMFVAQSLVARRFIAERERLADWRAMQTLAPAETERLLERRGRRRAAPNPTELEKLMIGLKAQSPPGAGGGLLPRLISLVWPEGDAVHQRVEGACRDRAGGEAQPVLWAVLIGMQCGFLSMSLSLAVTFAVAPWMGWRWYVTQAVMLTIMAWISGPAVAFCEMRVDPARMSMHAVKRTRVRVAVGLFFFLAFAAAALVLYRFYGRFGIVPMPPAYYFAGMLMLTAAVVGCCVWASGLIGGRDGGGELRETPHSPWVQLYPALAGLVLVLIPLSVAASSWLAMGSFLTGHWLALMTMPFATCVVSTSMVRSTNPTLRMIAPIALLDTTSPVYGFRLFWRDFYVDLSRTTVVHATTVAMAVQVIAMLFFALATGLLVERLRSALTPNATFAVIFVGSFAVMALVFVIPRRYSGYDSPWTRLLDRNRLQVFESLLAAARTAAPATADRLNTALAQWLRHEGFPDSVLPDRRSLWMLEPLLSLVRLANDTGETVVLDRWRNRIERSLRQIISDHAVAIAPGQPPSLYWTALAATIIDEAGLRSAFPFERMLDRIETLLDERLARETVNLLTDVVSACRLLRRRGRTGPDPQSIRRFARPSSLVSRPMLRQSLAELCELADLTDDAELRVKLGPIVRSRSWEGLQLNPRKDVLLLLDCYLAAAHLGETVSRQGAAALTVAEVARQASDELIAIVNG